MLEGTTFNWISYEVEFEEEITMALSTTKLTRKGEDVNGEKWSETTEVYRIAPHIILESYDGSSEFVFRILDEKLYRTQDEIVIDEEEYDLYVKTVGGYIDGFDIDFIEQNQELLVSKTFIKAIESLSKNK
ncbi:hypothetical protein CN514_07830 [Bacillus sp. AFS001701]|uniref:hypothetical protein n=1 Tax=Bacillus sp. AFS001701 TaxID=2033480 RepID=UPI000BF94822|nr:hypothetical protein [Bacillus sp. AFS001701]PET70077.1 hypothetical protein CN514_07830 [Bacillus sp. AFS001701]